MLRGKTKSCLREPKSSYVLLLGMKSVACMASGFSAVMNKAGQSDSVLLRTKKERDACQVTSLRILMSTVILK